MRWRSVLTAAAVLAGLATAACGDGRISEDEFVARANGFCEQYLAVARTFRTPRSPAEGEAQLNRRLALERRLRSDFSTIDAPDRFSPSVTRYLLLRDRRASQLRAQRAAVRRGDLAELVRQQANEQRLQGQLAALAFRAGLTNCAAI
jgi:hypothetical protein